MLKNITLSAEEILIERARHRAEAESTTLNAEFRRWLAQYAERPQSTADFQAGQQIRSLRIVNPFTSEA